MRLYLDLDNTLVNPITDLKGNVTGIIPRPGAEEFITKLSRDGDLYLLTAAQRKHADKALSLLWPASRLFKGIYSIEDMGPVVEQLEVIAEDPDLTPDEQIRLWSDIKPLFPPGVMFDDYAVGSWMYLLKAASIGIGPDRWIEVEHFGNGAPDQDGLRKAYKDFRKRFPNLIYMDGSHRRQRSIPVKIVRI